MQITYKLPDPAYEAYTWVLQDEHMQGVPSHISWDGGPFPMGTHAGNEVPRQVLVNGFPYARPEFSGQNPFGRVEPPKTLGDLTRWRTDLLPQIDELVQMLESFAPASVASGAWESTLADQDRAMWRVFSAVHLNTVISGYLAVDAFTNVFVERFGEGARGDINTLLGGFPNLSVERAAALWDLGRLAKTDPATQAAIESGRPLPETPAGQDFRDRFEEMLARFGFTTNIGGSHLPTWREDPSIPMALVRSYISLPDSRGPRQLAAEQEAARVALEGRIKATEPEGSELLRLLEMAQQYMPNLEDHNLLCDQRVGAAMRNRWLTVGRFLQDRGLRSADDVFYYRRPELIAILEGGDLLSQSTIDDRRELIAALPSNPPPPRLGKAEGAALEMTLKGVGASKGTYTGRARIIETLEEAGRLEPGDVLVCRMTSPPWSPFFATIGALVVNTGGMLSHGAVVAREFGIPAVVATTFATSRIPDGATVTVDGTSGVVTIHSA